MTRTNNPHATRSAVGPAGSKCYREREQTAHCMQNAVGALLDFERDHQKRDRKAEHGIARTFHTRDVFPATSKITITHSRMMRAGNRLRNARARAARETDAGFFFCRFYFFFALALSAGLAARAGA
jgi:hypothetical protein